MKTILPILIKKELTQFRRNSFLPRLLVILPLMLILVMPLVTQMDVKNVHVAVLDADGSSLTRRAFSHIANSPYFIMEEANDYRHALALLDDGQIDLIVSIPEAFERNLMAGYPDPIQIVANAVNATKGSQGMQYMVQTIAGTIGELQREVGAIAADNVITVEERYNPTANYRHFMIPALIIILGILFACFLPLLNIVSEKENGTIEQINVTPVGKFEFILGKLILYWVIMLIELGVSITLAGLVYGLWPAGNVAGIFLAIFLFGVCMSGFAVSIANISDNMQQAIFVMFFFAIIFMLMSGLFTPISSMPSWLAWVTYLFPPRYTIEIMRSIYLKGTLLSELWLQYTMLAVLAVAFCTLATVTYKKQK